MNDVTRTLGYAIYSGIEKDEYLNEIYDALLHNYFLQVFGITDLESKDPHLDDALRFADLLSKSVYTDNSEQHRSLAQEIATLLNTTVPDNDDVKFVLGSVLSNTNNYLGIQHSAPDYVEIDLMDRLSSEIIRDYLRIPSEEGSFFLRSQKAVFDHMTKDRYFSYSGPTSMGKSFVMRTFIHEKIKESPDKNYAIIVPTKALINEVSKEIAEKLGPLLRQYDYRIVTSAGAVVLQEKNEHRYVFVMTPERLMYQLIGFDDIPIHYLFVDEAQNISEHEGRSAFYYQVIGMLFRSKSKPHVIFASPHIPNPSLYLDLIPGDTEAEQAHMTSTFTPVCQEKFLIDLRTHQVGYYNGLTQSLSPLHSIGADQSFLSLVSTLGAGKKNLVYCNAKAKVRDYALDYASRLDPIDDPDLISLAEEIRELVHESYYLADTVIKGVAFHMGYLPTGIRLRIEDLFRKRDGGIHTIFCTSTLLEGVNLPADNLFITDVKNGSRTMSAVEFRNLIGRVGRLQYTLYGNVFLTCLPGESVEPVHYVSLLQQEVEQQHLSLSKLADREKRYVIDCLKKGVTRLAKLNGQTNEAYSMMRKAANMLLREIMLGRHTHVSRAFDPYLTPAVASAIREQFTGRQNEPDDDINVSLDQIDKLVEAIEHGLDYPKVNVYGYVGFQPTFDFLEQLCAAFDWETYESGTLGTVKNGVHTRLRYYTKLLQQWLTGNGVKYLIDEAIEHKKGNTIFINGDTVQFDDGQEHRNKVIEDTLNTVNDIILFRFSNYFMRFSKELKRIKHKDFLTNDWYEYVEYGTTNKLCIFLQKNGFSPEAATYIQKREATYVDRSDERIRLKRSVLDCERASVREEAITVENNMPELFVPEEMA